MSFIIPALVSGFSHAHTIVVLLRHKLPSMVSVKEISRGYDIKDKMKDVLEKHEIREDLKVFEAINAEIASAYGTNYFTKGDAALLASPEFYDVDEKALLWTMKHEVGHIKNNDCLVSPTVSLVSSLAMSIFATCTLELGVIPATLFSVNAGFVALVIFRQFCERRADNFAISNSTDDELKGGIRFFRAFQEADLSRRIMDKIMCSLVCS